MKYYNVSTKRSKVMKYFAIVTMIIMILNISMSSIFNIVEAVVTGNIPVTVVMYDSNDNSTVFPDSYKPYIKNLKALHPNWTFKALFLKLDWAESIRQESYEVNQGISLVPDSYSANWKKDGIDTYKDGSFVIASRKAVAYIMDPRNFLNETSVFQFEALDFNAETSTVGTIDKVIAGTVMSSYPTQYKRSGSMVNLENGLSWSQLIINSARNAGGSGISAVFLASRMRQETSLNILNNGSINGSNPTYPGVYNFFNMGATPNPDGSGSVTNGLAYASSKGWTTPQKSIESGAISLWSKWIQWGQNTTYFQKFDVSNIYGNAKFLYGSQYMTNILAPSSESRISYNAYKSSGILNSSFVFYIPVYDNMPTEISAHPDSELTEPTITGTDVVYLDDGVANGTDTFNARIGPSIDDDIVAQIVELREGADNRTKFTRTQVGTNGWDKIRLANGTEAYISQSIVHTYNYTHVTGISFSKASVSTKAGEITTLAPTIAPSNAYIKNVTWYSDNSNVAGVDINGRVKGISVGTANITAVTLDGSKTATYAVTVDKTLATSIAPQNTEYSLVVGNYMQPGVTVSPSTTTDKSYNIAVADTSIATVENGKIKGLKLGSTAVTLTTKDGSNKTCTFNLNIINSVATINNYTVDTSNIISKVPVGTKVSSINASVATTYTKKIVNANGRTLGDIDTVGTGTKVQILNEAGVVQEYTIVMYGDINGDGLIDVVDLLMLKRRLTNRIELSDVANKAANISRTTGEPDVTDLLRLRRHITNKTLIVQ